MFFFIAIFALCFNARIWSCDIVIWREISVNQSSQILVKTIKFLMCSFWNFFSQKWGVSQNSPTLEIRFGKFPGNFSKRGYCYWFPKILWNWPPVLEISWRTEIRDLILRNAREFLRLGHCCMNFLRNWIRNLVSRISLAFFIYFPPEILKNFFGIFL